MTRETEELDVKTVNFQSGCIADCQYCSARNVADKLGWKTWDDWINTKIRLEDVKKKHKQYEGTVIIPSTHNIDHTNFLAAEEVILELAHHENKMLVVMKPDPYVVDYLTSAFLPVKQYIEFRFTITTAFDEIRKLFEPRTSTINNRFLSILCAREKEYKVSISVEPFLDKNPIPLISRLLKYGIEPNEIWIGAMNDRIRLAQKSCIIEEHGDYLDMIYSPSNLALIQKMIRK